MEFNVFKENKIYLTVYQKKLLKKLKSEGTQFAYRCGRQISGDRYTNNLLYFLALSIGKNEDCKNKKRIP